MRASDTIAALATAPGVGAIAVIRVSGHDSAHIVKKLCANPSAELQDRVARLETLRNAEGKTLDQVLLTPFFGDRSFTGEPSVEISTHGGMLVTQRVLEALVSAGARHAEPGEFSQRAFLNGKLDLTQAEAIMDLIAAKTDLAMEAAHQQLTGQLSQHTDDLRQQIIGLMAQIEAYIDFPDEDISPETEEGWHQRIAELTQLIDQLLASAEQGRWLREGVRTVIYGKPNAGKSSLLNRLLGYERAIVSDIAGTTRDTVESMINLKGIPICLVDTAGVRDASDTVEKLGIERSEAALQSADLILHLMDGSQTQDTEDIAHESLPNNTKTRIIRLSNKSDQSTFQPHRDAIAISCETGEGISQLEDAIVDAIFTSGELTSHNLTAINQRHQACLIEAKQALAAAQEQISDSQPPEFIAVDLRDSSEAIQAISGNIDTEDILGEIFANFCIGK